MAESRVLVKADAKAWFVRYLADNDMPTALTTEMVDRGFLTVLANDDVPEEDWLITITDAGREFVTNFLDGPEPE